MHRGRLRVSMRLRNPGPLDRWNASTPRRPLASPAPLEFSPSTGTGRNRPVEFAETRHRRAGQGKAETLLEVRTGAGLGALTRLRAPASGFLAPRPDSQGTRTPHPYPPHRPLAAGKVGSLANRIPRRRSHSTVSPVSIGPRWPSHTSGHPNFGGSPPAGETTLRPPADPVMKRSLPISRKRRTISRRLSTPADCWA